MALQRFMRRGMASNATARRLVAASMQMSPSTERETVENHAINQPVMRCKAMQDTVQAGVQLFENEHFYQVASQKFPGRFFILVRRWTKKGYAEWQCSSSDEKVRQRCIRQVETYRQQIRQKAVA